MRIQILILRLNGEDERALNVCSETITYFSEIIVTSSLNLKIFFFLQPSPDHVLCMRQLTF